VNIVRIEPVSTVDWPNEVASVFFASGCNFKCPWCFNKELIPFDLDGRKVYSLEEALKLVPKQIDCIVLSGGEAFAQKGIIETIHALKSKGYRVAVHTNGSFPKLLEKVIYSLDYIAMDVKGKLNMYSTRCGTNVNTSDIFDSIRLITDRGFPHEFRTTAAPGIRHSEIHVIGKLLSSLNAHTYYLQPYIEVRDKPKNDYLTVGELREIAKTLPLKTIVRG